MVLARQEWSHRAGRAGLCTVLVFVVLGLYCFSAQAAASIAQAFLAGEDDIVSGAIVSLSQEEATSSVELSTRANNEHVIGVASSQTVGPAAGDTVQVVTDGSAVTLVSNINGDVRAGDKITASPIAGVGMKATQSGVAVGTAQESLGGNGAERVITDKDGKRRAVRIGSIALQIAPAYYEITPGTSSFVPSVFQDFADNLAGHRVSPVRVMTAGSLVLLLFVVVTVLLYSAVRSSLISIGRNPLSEHALRKSLLQVGLIILGILAFAVASIYLILTL